MPGVLHVLLHTKISLLQDESRIKATAMDVKPVNYREYSKRLIANIRRNAQLGWGGQCWLLEPRTSRKNSIDNVTLTFFLHPMCDNSALVTPSMAAQRSGLSDLMYFSGDMPWEVRVHSDGHDFVVCCGLLNSDSAGKESLDRLPGSLRQTTQYVWGNFALFLYVKLNYITILSSLQGSSDNLDTLTCSAEGRRNSVTELSDLDKREQVY